MFFKGDKSDELLNKFLKELRTDIDEKTEEGGQLFIFLGAGFSANYKLPNWNKLVEDIIKTVMYHDEIEARGNSTEIQLFLFKILQVQENVKMKISLLKQLFEVEKLPLGIVYDILKEKIKVGRPDDILKGIPADEQQLLKRFGKIKAKFVTTNFDDVLKITLGINSQVVELEDYFNNLHEGVIHLHGALSKTKRDSFLDDITFDFESYVEKYNSGDLVEGNLFRQIFSFDKKNRSDKNTILFLGSSLQEGEIMGHIREEPSFARKYALMGFASEYDYKIFSKYYLKNFGIEIIGYDASLNHSLFSKFVHSMITHLSLDLPTDGLDFIDEINKELEGDNNE